MSSLPPPAAAQSLCTPYMPDRFSLVSIPAVACRLFRNSLARHCRAAAFGGLFLFILALGQSLAAPYPRDGLLTKWTQPDGTQITLRVFGDEFYGRTATKEGYTVVFDPADKTYYFATVGADGVSLVSSGVPAGGPPPAGLGKHLEESRERIAAVRALNIERLAPDRDARWGERIKATQQRRASQAAGVPVPMAAAAAGDPLAAPVVGTRVGLMILVQFPDDPKTPTIDPVNFPTTQAKITRYCNEVGYADDGNTGSIRDYYYDQSNGKLSFTHSVTAVVTLPQPRNYYNYSDYPTNTKLFDSGLSGRMLVTDAIAKLKTSGFDFSNLSVDGSNNVLATSLLFAGNDSGVWPKGLWPHAWQLAAPVSVGKTGSPRYISAYQCTDIPTAAQLIGTVCHELGHLMMGYPDFYDYGGESEGVGEHSLMGSGNYNNGGRTPAPIDLYLKDASGWANITDITPSDVLTVSLPSTGNVGYRIYRPGSTTEYFLIENRGPGDKWADYAVDKGVAIWHADENVSGNDNEQMTSGSHYELSIEQADGRFDLEAGRNRGDTGDLFDLNDGRFNGASNPDADWWSGAASGISVTVLGMPAASVNVSFGGTSTSTTLVLKPAIQDITAAGGNFTFAVSANTNWSWSTSAPWVSSTEAVTQPGPQTFSYSVAANSSTANRTASITFVAGDLVRSFTVSQAGIVVDDHGNSIVAATLIGQNSTTNGTFEKGGDNDYFRINVTSNGTLSVESTGSTDTAGDLLDATGKVLASDDDNGTDFNFRIGYAVTKGTYFIRAKAVDPNATGSYQVLASIALTPSLSVNPVSQNVVALGATHTFAVASNTLWSWTTDADWVTSAEPPRQSGNQVFTYAVAANTDPSPRNATITLTGGGLAQSFAVAQAAGLPDDFGNTRATAATILANSTTSASLEVPGDTDVFRFDVASPGFLTFEARGAVDTYGILLDSAGLELAADDDSGAESNFRISKPVEAGTYYILVKTYEGRATGRYELVGSLSNASLMVNPATHNVAAGGDSFTFAVTSNATWAWSSDAAWVTSAEPASQTGNQDFSYTVAANPYPSGRAAKITITDGVETQTHTVTQPAGFVDDHGNTLAAATPITEASVTGGAVETPGDNDYFRIRVKGSGTLTIETTGDGDTYGYLLDAAGAQLAFDDESGAGSNFKITRLVTAGIYHVRVRLFSGAVTGTYQLSSSFVPAAAPEISVEQPGGGVLKSGGSTIDFGSVVSGESASKTITVRNSGNLTLSGLSVSVDGAGAPDFVINTAGMSTSLDPGLSTSFQISYHGAALGQSNAAVHIASNDDDENPFNIEVSGLALSNVFPQEWVTLLNGKSFVGMIGTVDPLTGKPASPLAGHGTIELKTTASAASAKVVSGSALIGATRYRILPASIGLDGSISLTLAPAKGNWGNAQLVFQVVEGSGRLNGELKNVTASAIPISLLPQAYSGKKGDACPRVGTRVNCHIKAQGADMPSVGHGFLAAVVNADGSGGIAGQLPDDTAFSAKLSGGRDAAGDLKLGGISVLAGKKGLLVFSLTLAMNPAADEPDLQGEILWIRSPLAKVLFAPEGFSKAFDVIGLVWQKGTSFPLGAAGFFLDADKAAVTTEGPRTFSGQWATGVKPAIATPTLSAFTYTPATGRFSGKLPSTLGGKSIQLKYQGLLLASPVMDPAEQKIQGWGYLFDRTHSASVEIRVP